MNICPTHCIQCVTFGLMTCLSQDAQHPHDDSAAYLFSRQMNELLWELREYMVLQHSFPSFESYRFFRLHQPEYKHSTVSQFSSFAKASSKLQRLFTITLKLSAAIRNVTKDHLYANISKSMNYSSKESHVNWNWH